MITLRTSTPRQISTGVVQKIPRGPHVYEISPQHLTQLREYTGKHRGHRGFLVAGGPSLAVLRDEEKFDFAYQLAQEVVVGVNLAYRLLIPTYLVFGDHFFWKTFREDVIALSCVKFAPQDVIKGFDTAKDPLLLPVRRGSRKHAVLPPGLDAAIPFVNNSGVAALRIMRCLGLNPVYLLGVDLVPDTEGNTHFHNDYKKKVKTSQEIYKSFRLEYVRTINALKEQGVEVYSCSPISSLNTVIPYIPVTSLFSL